MLECSPACPSLPVRHQLTPFLLVNLCQPANKLTLAAGLCDPKPLSVPSRPARSAKQKMCFQKLGAPPISRICGNHTKPPSRSVHEPYAVELYMSVLLFVDFMARRCAIQGSASLHALNGPKLIHLSRHGKAHEHLDTTAFDPCTHGAKLATFTYTTVLHRNWQNFKICKLN